MHPLYLLDAGREALTLLPIMSHVRTRFAPSPTGYLHIGGARTALFNWLFARKMGGTFILRIEDTDNARNTEEATRAIFTGMEWLGLDWDEGPMKGGDCGPYFQSQRNDIYDAYFKKLQDAGRVYEDEGAWRFRFDRSKPVTFHDLICGDITIDYRDASNTPDMAIRRADGSYIFHFVNVVDDIEMKMTHVIRGEDHIMNTPKHIQLFEAFGVTPPVFAHMPLILNQDGSKMSKRDVGAALGTYPEEGFLPEGVSKVQPEALELLFKLADRLEQEPEWDGHELIGVLKAFAKENGVKMGAVMFPARVALTGLSGGPDLSSVFSLLGREETVRRIRSFSLD